MIYEVCAAAATLMFVALGIYAIRTMAVARESLTESSRAMEELLRRSKEVGDEALQLLKGTQALTEELRGKLESLEPLAESLRDAGAAAKMTAAAMKQVAGSVTRSAADIETRLYERRDRIADAAEWAAVAMQWVAEWQSRRSAKISAQHEKEDHRNG